MFTPGGNNKTNQQKLELLEEEMKKFNQQMMSYKFKSTFFVGFFMIIFMSFLSNIYSGVVVARLPFEPFSLIRGVTHRNLPGSDFTECSMIFIYILCNVCIRPLIVKILGFEPPRGLGSQSPFGQMPGQ